MVGVDMNPTQQFKLLNEAFPKFRDEWSFPQNKSDAATDHDFYLNNATFGGGGDAEVLHSMIRYFKPKRIMKSAQASQLTFQRGHAS